MLRLYGCDIRNPRSSAAKYRFVNLLDQLNPQQRETADGSKPRRINGGRVEISLLKNGIGDLNTAPGTAPTATNQEPNQQPQESSTPR